jgi:hypothetical protein
MDCQYNVQHTTTRATLARKPTHILLPLMAHETASVLTVVLRSYHSSLAEPILPTRTLHQLVLHKQCLLTTSPMKKAVPTICQRQSWTTVAIAQLQES